MNTEEMRQIVDQLEGIDNEIDAIRIAINDGDTFAVVGSKKFSRPSRVEITKEMALPFLEIGLKSLQRKRSQVAAKLREK